jgi:Xaa-Pro aminopeptidase
MQTALTSLQGKLARKRYDAMLVSQPENRRYLSGYSATDASINESSGYLLILKQGPPFLLTDSRFQLQAEKECPNFEVVLYKKGVLNLLQKLAASLQIKRLAFESEYFLFSQALELQKFCKKKGITPIPCKNLIETQRAQKTHEELSKIRRSVLLNEKVFQKVYRGLKPGISEVEVALQIESLMRQYGAERPSFETIVASGPNGALPHAVPSQRKIAAGEPVVIDMGLVLDGLCSDMTRTVVLGAIDDFSRNIFKIVRQAQLKALRTIKAGVPCHLVDRAARKIITEKGYGDNFGHGLGHGVGYAVHEAPSLSPRSRKKLKAGMVVTVEPGIYIPGWGGVRLENMAVVQENGIELLNQDETFLNPGDFCT